MLKHVSSLHLFSHNSLLAVPTQQKMLEAKLRTLHRLRASDPPRTAPRRDSRPPPLTALRSEAAAKCLRVTSDENELECARRASLLCCME
jgi:hypothetical protein